MRLRLHARTIVLRSTVVLRGNSLRAALDATLAGMRLTVLPCQVAGPEKNLQRISEQALGTRALSLVVHPGLAKVARVRVVMDFLAEIVERDRALLLG